MCWICPNCSSANEEENLICSVCDCERPADKRGGRKSKIRRGEGGSRLSAVKDSVKRFFRGLAGKLSALKKKMGASGSKSCPQPWPEHEILLMPDVIRRKGYKSIAQATKEGIRGYELIREDGSRRFVRVEILLAQKMAEKR